MNTNITEKLQKNKTVRLNFYGPSKFMDTQHMLANKPGQSEFSLVPLKTFSMAKFPHFTFSE